MRGLRKDSGVIVMTAYSSDCLDLTTELHAHGASEFIAKPFSNKGRTLASVIRKVLSDQPVIVPDAPKQPLLPARLDHNP